MGFGHGTGGAPVWRTIIKQIVIGIILVLVAIGAIVVGLGYVLSNGLH